MQKARDRVRDYFSRYVPRYKEHNGCNQPMVYGVVELLSDDPVSIAVSIYWSLYSETASRGSLINRKTRRILYENLAKRGVPCRMAAGTVYSNMRRVVSYSSGWKSLSHLVYQLGRSKDLVLEWIVTLVCSEQMDHIKPDTWALSPVPWEVGSLIWGLLTRVSILERFLNTRTQCHHKARGDYRFSDIPSSNTVAKFKGVQTYLLMS